MKQKLLSLFLLVIALFIYTGCNETGSSSCSMTSDNNCPATCTEKNDIDCKNQAIPLTCGDGKFDPAVETCDDSATGHICPTSNNSCDEARRTATDAADRCLQWTLEGDAAHCNVKCVKDEKQSITANPAVKDLCCPAGANRATDPDCPKEILNASFGEPCTDDTACGGGTCLKLPAFTGGYCAAKIDEANQECGTNGVAVDLAGERYCVKSCNTPTDCRTSGYTCSNGACLPTATCGDGTFDSTTETCDDTVLGHTCPKSNDDCEDARRAAPDADRCFKFEPQGTDCNVVCQKSATAIPASNTAPDLCCPAGTYSDTDPDCPSPPTCDSIKNDGVCPAGCNALTDLDCTNKAPIQATNIGGPCTGDSNCAVSGTGDGVCITSTRNPNYQNGYCAGTVIDPAKQECPTGSRLKQVKIQGVDFDVCLKECAQPSDCRSNEGYTCADNVCVPLCGNGQKESTETCDSSSTNPDDHCYAEAECMARTASLCKHYVFKGGDPNTCTAQCVEEPLPATSGDSCCAPGDDITTDSDCTNKHKLALKNVGSACTDNTACGTEGACITTTTDSAFTGGYCSGEITDTSKYECPDGTVSHNYNGKQLCLKTCTKATEAADCRTTDYRCETFAEGSACVPNIACGNGTLDRNETCDPNATNPTQKCKTQSDCDSMTGAPSGQEYKLTGDPCKVQCTLAPITLCKGGDNFCPPGCDASSDSDCKNKYKMKLEKVGETCTGDTECGVDGECRKGLFGSGGYCLSTLNPAKNQACPAGSTQTTYLEEDLCLKSCDVTNKCSKGFNCKAGACVPDLCNGTCTADQTCLVIDFNESTPKGVCAKNCQADKTSCGSDELCSALPGYRDAYCLKNCTSDSTKCNSITGTTCVTSPSDSASKICYADNTKINAKTDIACKHDSDCGPEGRCLPQSPKGEYIDGLCYVPLDKNGTCPSGLGKVQIGYFGPGCLKNDASQTCRQGYEKAMLTPGFCTPKKSESKYTSCPSSGSCSTAGETCRNIAAAYDAEYCVPESTGTLPLGSDCHSFAECSGGGNAVCKQYDFDKQLGYCTKDCSKDPNICDSQQNEHCTEISTNYHLCLKTCTTADECSPVPGDFVCGDASMTDKTQVCKKPPKLTPQVTKIGEACKSDSDCGKEGTCLLNKKGGYCAFVGSSLSYTCPQGSSWDANRKYCGKTCTSDPECRTSEGYTCKAASFGDKICDL